MLELQKVNAKSEQFLQEKIDKLVKENKEKDSVVSNHLDTIKEMSEQMALHKNYRVQKEKEIELWKDQLFENK